MVGWRHTERITRPRPRPKKAERETAERRSKQLPLSPRRNATVAVITQSVARRPGRAGAWPYITEVLHRAGLFHTQLPPEALTSLRDRGHAIVVLAGHLPLAAEQREALREFVKSGGAVIGIGGTSGLDEVFGVSGPQPVAEGWLKVTAQDHPITSRMCSSLHVFGGFVMRGVSGSSLAALSPASGSQGQCDRREPLRQGTCDLVGPGSLVLHRAHSTGCARAAGPRPPADDSAPTNDGVLKAEDGLVLDWQRDRQAYAARGCTCVPGTGQ